MKVLYLGCSMGAAGDMLSAALPELLPECDRERFVGRLNHLGLPGVTFRAESAEKCGIVGTHMKVLVNGIAEESTGYDDGHGCGDSPELDECASGYSCGHDNDNVHHHDHERHERESAHLHYNHHVHRHEHHSLGDIEQIVSRLDAPEVVKGNVLAVYNLIAQAESHAHGRPCAWSASATAAAKRTTKQPTASVRCWGMRWQAMS